MSTPLLRPHVRPSPVRSALAGALLLTLAVSPGMLSASTIPTFVPIGAGYEADTLEQFAREAANVDTSGQVSIVVLPIAYGVDPLSMSNGLRKTNLTLADNRRGQIEAACLAVIPSGETCHVVLAPVLVRADAFLEANLDLVDTTAWTASSCSAATRTWPCKSSTTAHSRKRSRACRPPVR